jgi:2-keto-4-pentenoate hydratase/2-oxohepta-3-ene-1,7-dioic acid hydratase in catechol pathway
MKWMRFERDGQPVLGRLEGDHVHVHDGDLFDAPRPTGEVLPAASLRWLMPCAPRTMFALWNNFQAAAQKNQWAVPAEPLYFVKPAASFAAHGQPIPAAAPEVGRIAYEGELAIVIGRPTHRVAANQARTHIFGYTCANDMTAIELLHRDPAFAQWSRAKGLPGFGVIGPAIETVFDPAAAHVRTVVGGRERQNYPLADMIFPPHELVARISQDILLEPGDVILCGTSLGVMPVKPGSEITVAIDGIGELTNIYG